MAGGGGTPGSSGTIELNVIPLVDVACLLIMFFILTSQFASANFASMELASPVESVAQKDKVENVPNRVIVNIVCMVNPQAREVDPALSLQAKEYSVGGNAISLDQVESLEGLFKEKMAEAKKAGHADFIVEIRSDKRVAFNYVEPVMIQAAKANVPKMNITAMERAK